MIARLARLLLRAHLRLLCRFLDAADARMARESDDMLRGGR